MARKAFKKAAAGKGLCLYYLDCLLHLEREPASSTEAKLLLKKSPDYVVGFYTKSADRKLILEDAAYVKDLLWKKRAA